MKIPLSYMARNLGTPPDHGAHGWRSGAGGVRIRHRADAGRRAAQHLVTTGEYDNVVVMRRGAETEVQSFIDRVQANIAASHPAIARDAAGQPWLSKETVVLISLIKRDSGKPSNVIIRGIAPDALTLRPQVKLTAGRMFRSGASEIIAGASVARRFNGAGIGEKIRFGQREWTVVGFDAGNSGFDSEIWGDADQLMPAFRRNAYSAMVLRLADGRQFEQFKHDIENDQRLTLDAKREQTFYADQSKALSTFISVLGLILSVIFSIGAMIGATITMYASVANRVGEIGTLRALGFQRRSILAAFLSESMLLAVVGGALGLACASLMQFISFDHQLPIVFRTGFRLPSDWRHHRENLAVLASHGRHRRLPACAARGPHAHRRRPACRLSRYAVAYATALPQR
jgi:ABC-type lipoprotein release transport system permease subunit